MKFSITTFQDEDGMYIAECPSIPGCVSQGRTEAEAKFNIQDAIRESLEARKILGLPLVISTTEVEVAI
ncbi:MAG: type II toxin-antitoxin system HicB family antitoxin [bacterium]